MKLRLRVPATTANIGPGFDSLGLALSLYNWFTLEPAAATSVSGCEEKYSGKDNLFLKALDYASGLLGKPTPVLRLAIDARIPVARGLGSSATMIVGGVAAALLLSEGWEGLVQGRKKLSSEELGFILEASAALEGHPDNVTPALYGGFCVAVAQAGSGQAGSGQAAILSSRCEVDPGWRFHALIPPFELETAKARAALPALLPRADAVFNLGRAALLALAFARKDPTLLGAACDDRIHQPYRKALIAGYDEVMAACHEAGAAAAWLSGAGPTLIALTAPGAASAGQPTADSFERHVGTILAARPEGAWRMESLAADPDGLIYAFEE
ncbi:MAG: homoserine kinase [Rectinemataceae bacterium]|nr:homoserine kinase [Rectinemataceae bacterium]